MLALINGSNQLKEYMNMINRLVKTLLKDNFISQREPLIGVQNYHIEDPKPFPTYNIIPIIILVRRKMRVKKVSVLITTNRQNIFRAIVVLINR